MHHQQHGQPYQPYHHPQAVKQDKKSSHKSNKSYSHSSSHKSHKSHKSNKSKSKSNKCTKYPKHINTESKYDNDNDNDNDVISAHCDEKDDLKQDTTHNTTHGRLTSHVGYASASNTISPQDSNTSNNNNNNKKNNENTNLNGNNNKNNNYCNFTDATVKELSNSLGFEEEYVKMALVQSQGDITLAAEILFQMNDKTIKAMKKHEKEKRKKQSSIPNFNATLIEEILGMKMKLVKKQWKRVICDKSKSELRSISRKECINYHESSSESTSPSESDSSDNHNANNLSFYKKNKKEMDTLCQCASNILFILCLYSKWKLSNIDQNLYFHVIIDSFLPHYSMIQLINDFQHLHIYHWDHCELFEEFEKIMGKCQVSKCLSFHRHFRDRLKYKNDMKRYKLYDIYVKNMNEGKYDKNELFLKEIICKQWMDEMHCYLLHSLTRFEIDYEEESEEEEEDEHSKNSTSRSRSTSRGSRNSAYMSRSQSPSNNLSVNYGQNTNTNNKPERPNKLIENERLMRERRDELVKYGYGRSYARNKDTMTNKEEKEYEYKLGIFEWQSTLNINNNNINPRYNNMRDEILNNPYYKLTILEYNELYFKCQQISKTWIKKKIKSKDKYVGVIGYKNNGEKEEKLKVEKGSLITADMILAIKLYTDYDKLQYELKKCLRSSGNDLSNLYWWRNMISIVVCLYGNRMKKNKFFYGLSDKLELQRYGGFGLFVGPLSLTVSLSVAKMYANENGMLLQLGNGHPWLRSSTDAGNGKYFDVSCLSDYKNEHEILTMLFTTRIFMVSLNQYIDTNINNISENLFIFICKLFEKCIFSMNYELEYLLIQLITAHLNQNQTHKYFDMFDKLCVEKENLLLWDISYGLQDFFMISTQYDDDFDDDSMTMNHGIESEDDDSKLLISFEKINELFINLKSLTLINHILSREVFYQFIDYLNKNNGNISFEIITFYFPKYKKLPRHLKINQLQHVWQKYLNQHKWHIVAYKYGYSLSPMIVIQKIHSNLLPFIGQSKNNYLNQFVKITK